MEYDVLEKFMWNTELAEMIADEDDGSVCCYFDVTY